MVTEFLAVLSNLHLPPEARVQFLPDPYLDLTVAISYYLPLAFCVALLLTFLDIDQWVMFVIGGIYGIITERDSAILLSFNIILWLYVFLVYGSFLSLPAFALRSLNYPTNRKKINRFLTPLIAEAALIFTFYVLIRIAMLIMFILMKISL